MIAVQVVVLIATILMVAGFGELLNMKIERFSELGSSRSRYVAGDLEQFGALWPPRLDLFSIDEESLARLRNCEGGQND